MPDQSHFQSPTDGTMLATYRWDTGPGAPQGVVQIAHGLAEHGQRYDRLARALVEAGYQVHAVDHRGHGKSATSRDQLGHFSFPALIRDVADFGAAIKHESPELPLFLIAHSMGSFAAQEVLLTHAGQYAGVVLSGSSALDMLAENLAQAEGPAGLEAFNAGFEQRTGYEWLSRDEAEVDQYVADPLCGFDVPEESLAQLFADAARLADPQTLSAIASSLPILIASGDADPVSGGGQWIQPLGQRYRDAGIEDVTVKLYPGARHEIFNETNRDEITADVLDWLRRHNTNA